MGRETAQEAEVLAQRTEASICTRSLDKMRGCGRRRSSGDIKLRRWPSVPAPRLLNHTPTKANSVMACASRVRFRTETIGVYRNADIIRKRLVDNETSHGSSILTAGSVGPPAQTGSKVPRQIQHTVIAQTGNVGHVASTAAQQWHCIDEIPITTAARATSVSP